MPTTIKLKNSVTTTNAPSSLVQGEVAINITDKKVWVGNAATTPVQLLGDGGSASFTSIAFGAGTVSNPSITFTGDTNTGIYSPAADTIAFTEGGVESMRIDSAGNVGIGTNSPETKLSVYGDSVNNVAGYIENNNAAGSVGSDKRLNLSMGGSSAFGITGWQNAGVVEGTSTGGLWLGAYNGAIKFGTGSSARTERMRIDSNGAVMVGGTTTASATGYTFVNALGSNGGSFEVYTGTTRQGQYFCDATSVYFGSVSNIPLLLRTNNTERMRIDSSGNVLVGTTTNLGKVSVQGTITAKASADESILSISHNGSEAVISASYGSTGSYDPMVFKTSDAERMRITTGGTGELIVGGTTATLSNASRGSIIANGSSSAIFQLNVGNANQSYVYHDSGGMSIWNATNTVMNFATNNTERMRITAGGNVLINTTTFNGGATVGLQINATSSASNAYAQLIKNSGGTEIFQMRCDGGLGNYSANNSNLSDERVKTDIKLADSYLGKVCAIPVKTFKYKNQTDDLLNLGVIAQDVEAVAPELVDVTGFGDTPDDGIPLKAIYQTDLQYALMKAIQEQQALIENLTTRLNALEGN